MKLENLDLSTFEKVCAANIEQPRHRELGNNIILAYWNHYSYIWYYDNYLIIYDKDRIELRKEPNRTGVQIMNFYLPEGYRLFRKAGILWLDIPTGVTVHYSEGMSLQYKPNHAVQLEILQCIHDDKKFLTELEKLDILAGVIR